MSFVQEDSFVLSKDNGFLRIKNVEVGDYILARESKNHDSFTEVISKTNNVIENSVRIKANNGCYLNVDDVRNLLTHNDSYVVGENNIKNVILPSKNYDVFNFDEELSEVGWFIGMHTGDGTCDRKHVISKLRDYYKYRIRVLGDNEAIIKRYADFVNKELDSFSNYTISTRPDYKSVVWTYAKCCKNVEHLVDKYFDGKFGNKTYSGNVYSYVIKNNLWIPYIAGLMDSDGAIKQNGTLEISICMKDTIEYLCNVLSKSGIRYHVSCKTSVRKNEKPLYRLSIYLNEVISTHICNYMGHEIKINKINNGTKTKFFSPNLYKLDENILDNINNTKFTNSLSLDYKNSHTLKHLIKKQNGRLGLGGLNHFKGVGIITDDQYEEIIRRESIKEISNVSSPSNNFVSLKTESGNFYAGNFGLINVQC